MASPLPAAARVALRRVQLAVHPDKMQQPAARLVNSTSLALLNAYVDALEQPAYSLERLRLHSVQLRFLFPRATQADAPRAAKKSRMKRKEHAAEAEPALFEEVVCTLPGPPGGLQPLFSAFAHVIGTEVAAAAGAGGEEGEASSEEGAAPAAAAPAEVKISTDWLRSVASAASATRVAYVARKEAQDAAVDALARSYGVRLCISYMVPREKLALAHIAALDAALRETEKRTLRHLRKLTLIILDETANVPLGAHHADAAAYASDAERSAGRAYFLGGIRNDQCILHLALSSSADDYAASVRAIAAALSTVARDLAAAAAEATKTLPFEQLCTQAAKALLVNFIFYNYLSPGSPRRQHVATFCHAIIAQPAPWQRRHVSIGVRVDAAVQPPTQWEEPYPLAWSNACGTMQIALHPDCQMLLVAADVKPGDLHAFLAQHRTQVLELQNARLAPARAFEAARYAAQTAL